MCQVVLLLFYNQVFNLNIELFCQMFNVLSGDVKRMSQPLVLACDCLDARVVVGLVTFVFLE